MRISKLVGRLEEIILNKIWGKEEVIYRYESKRLRRCSEII